MSARENLIRAAAELLPAEGYAAMSPAAIQRRAGAGQGSMYHHFSGKADLARVALEHNANELLAAAQATLEASGAPIDRVCAYLQRERDPLLGCPIGRVAQDRAIAEDDRLRAPVTDMFTSIEKQIAEVLGQEPRVRSPEALAATVLAVLQGGYVLARAANARAPFDRAIDGAIELLQSIPEEGSR